jgi:hypothetical protein
MHMRRRPCNITGSFALRLFMCARSAELSRRAAGKNGVHGEIHIPNKFAKENLYEQADNKHK